MEDRDEKRDDKIDVKRVAELYLDAKKSDSLPEPISLQSLLRKNLKDSDFVEQKPPQHSPIIHY